MKKGVFITIEGIDGCGKTTQTQLLGDYLTKKGFSIVKTREPGGTSLAENLRNILLNPESVIYPLTELFLYAASRAQHTQELILPSLNEGKVVICERYIDASLAYQGYARDLDIELIKELNNIATGGLRPDITFLFDLPVEEAIRFKKNNNFLFDRLEREEITFHEKVRKGYLKIAEEEKQRFRIIEVKGSIEEVHNKIIEEWEKFYGNFSRK